VGGYTFLLKGNTQTKNIMWMTKSNNKEFKAGDLVQLISGGPTMNIERIEDTVIVCIWFDKQDNLKTDSFISKNLKKVNNE